MSALTEPRVDGLMIAATRPLVPGSAPAVLTV